MNTIDRNLINKLYTDTYNHISVSNYKRRTKELGTVYLQSSSTSAVILNLLIIEKKKLLFMEKIHNSKDLKSIIKYLYNLDNRYKTLLKNVDYIEVTDVLSEIEENIKKASV